MTELHFYYILGYIVLNLICGKLIMYSRTNYYHEGDTPSRTLYNQAPHKFSNVEKILSLLFGAILCCEILLLMLINNIINGKKWRKGRITIAENLGYYARTVYQLNGKIYVCHTHGWEFASSVLMRIRFKYILEATTDSYRFPNSIANKYIRAINLLKINKPEFFEDRTLKKELLKKKNYPV